jgi:hypothetical protein
LLDTGMQRILDKGGDPAPVQKKPKTRSKSTGGDTETHFDLKPIKREQPLTYRPYPDRCEIPSDLPSAKDVSSLHLFSSLIPATRAKDTVPWGHCGESL